MVARVGGNDYITFGGDWIRPVEQGRYCGSIPHTSTIFLFDGLIIRQGTLVEVAIIATLALTTKRCLGLTTEWLRLGVRDTDAG